MINTDANLSVASKIFTGRLHLLLLKYSQNDRAAAAIAAKNRKAG